MPDLLVELGCEEIPARMVGDGLSILLVTVHDSLNLNRLLPPDFETSKIQQYCTPRRISVYIPDVIVSQEDVEEQLVGPALKVALKDGKATPAGEAFAKKAGVPFGKLETVKMPKGEYVVARVLQKGRTAKEILTSELPKNLKAFYWPKVMYWREHAPERFVRPIRWIVALLGSEVIQFEYAGVKSGRISRGHRILGSADVEIPLPAAYEKKLRKAFVVVSRSERRSTIWEQLVGMAGKALRIQDTDPHFSGLLDTVTDLTEWPSVICGSFDESFLSLPQEVLVTVMRDHQKYFAVEDAAGKLAPRFLAVLNTDGDPDGLIRHGNERVLSARFNDAQFFWNFDNRTPFSQRRELLKHVTFQKDLGNYYDKTERIVRAVDWLRWPGVLSKSGAKIDLSAAVEAARLAKNDLTTELVKEFTELQGIVGGLYAEVQGLPKVVADAIYDHYKPESMQDSVPRTPEGAVLSIADKADSIAGMFALGLIPSGSRDPFALRRQANGIVKTIQEHRLAIDLPGLIEDARVAYEGSEAEKKFTLNGEAYTQAICAFFRERLEFYLRDTLGLAYDVVNATLASGARDVVDAIARAQAVAKVRPSADFESISISFKRMKNILRQAAETNKRVAEPFSRGVLVEEGERRLAAAIDPVAKKVDKLRADRDYEPALIEISRLRPEIDLFFDKVMVMVDDETLRMNRLGLLQTLVREFSSIADFSEIVTEKK